MNLSDDYYIGFVEGEGMFYVGVVPSKETKSGWQVIYFFKVPQNPSGKEVLEKLKRRLSCGYIKANSQTDKTDKSLAFVVRDLPSLINKVIPFFENKLVIKKDAFKKFKQVILLVKNREHISKNGIKKVIKISYSMNTRKRKFTEEEILKSYS
ncbi:LAGLIDADG family homing endonuclease [Candidatus Woesebacteria bacterium]|nr:LAGLIDADG family homing endonuclease [Candidatus Woesebacteria bacterium]